MLRTQFILIYCLLLIFNTSFRTFNHIYEYNSADTTIYLPLILRDFGISPTETPTGPRPTRTRTPTTTPTQTRTSTPFRTFTPLPTSTITPTITLTPTWTFTPTFTPTTTYIPLPEISLVYPTFTPSSTYTQTATQESTNTQTPVPLFGSRGNQSRLGILAFVGLVWVLLTIWLIILIRRTRINRE